MSADVKAWWVSIVATAIIGYLIYRHTLSYLEGR